MPKAGVAGGLVATLAPEPDLAALGAEWQAMQAECDHSFFQSWFWIGTLLRCTRRTPLVLRIRDGDRLVGLSAWFPAPVALPWHRRLALSQLGDERYDCIYVEYNGLLAARHYADPVRRAALAALREAAAPSRDRYLLGGVPADYAAAAAADGWIVHEHETKEVFNLELDRLPAPDRHLAMLSRNVRQQIRRSLRFYGETVGLSAAADVNEALTFMDRLQALHQASWRERGRPGAFAQPFFAAFHRRLIADHFDSGHLEVVRVAAGNDDIGYLYNFIYGDRVYFYQSGLHYLRDNRARPGLISHHLCIEAHAAAGRLYYDFMAGEQRYKTDLGARPAGRLIWIELRRPLRNYLPGRDVASNGGHN